MSELIVDGSSELIVLMMKVDGSGIDSAYDESDGSGIDSAYDES